MHAARNGSSSTRRAARGGGNKKKNHRPPVPTHNGPIHQQAPAFKFEAADDFRSMFDFANENRTGSRAPVVPDVPPSTWSASFARPGNVTSAPTGAAPPVAASAAPPPPPPPPPSQPPAAAPDGIDPLAGFSFAGFATPTAPEQGTWSCAYCAMVNGADTDVCSQCKVLNIVAKAFTTLSGEQTPNVVVDGVAAAAPAADARTDVPPAPPQPPPAAAAGAAPATDGDDVLREKLSLELRVQQLEHNLELANADRAWQRERLDTLHAEVAATRMQAIKDRNNAAAKSAAGESDVELKELKREKEHARQAFLEERQRWKREMDQRMAELKEARTAEREQFAKCQQLAAEKSALERTAELARARADMLAAREVAARKEVQLTVMPVLERSQADGLVPFLRMIYLKFPPKDPKHRLGPLDALSLDRTTKQAVHHYHTDKQDVDLYGLVWRDTCNSILQILNALRNER